VIRFHEIPGSGFSSIDPGASDLGRLHGYNTNAYEVQCLTLSQVFTQQADQKTVHFLKIDVEGHELEVIRSMDWQTHRPIVVLVEAVAPGGRTDAWSEWEPILLDANYNFVLFDGLNRFYLRQESADLKERFALPPNVFDGFLLSPNHTLRLSWKRSVLDKLELFLPKPVFKHVLKLRQIINNFR
jgi:hypothetical protein